MRVLKECMYVCIYVRTYVCMCVFKYGSSLFISLSGYMYVMEVDVYCIESHNQIVNMCMYFCIDACMYVCMAGDSVVLELSAYDLTRGRITFRNK